MPDTIPDTVPTEKKKLVTSFEYNAEGQAVTVQLPNERAMTNGFNTPAGVPGNVVATTRDRAPGVADILTTLNYDNKHTHTHGTIESITRRHHARYVAGESRAQLITRDDTITHSVQFDDKGRPTFSGTIDPTKVTTDGRGDRTSIRRRRR
jgi:hypothetical protein